MFNGTGSGFAGTGSGFSGTGSGSVFDENPKWIATLELDTLRIRTSTEGDDDNDVFNGGSVSGTSVTSSGSVSSGSSVTSSDGKNDVASSLSSIGQRSHFYFSISYIYFVDQFFELRQFESIVQDSTLQKSNIQITIGLLH